MYSFHFIIHGIVFLFPFGVSGSHDGNSGDETAFRILDSKRAGVDQFLYIVLVYVSTWDQELVCTGTIVAVDLVLTSADCLRNARKEDIKVVFGHPDMTNWVKLERHCFALDNPYCCSTAEKFYVDPKYFGTNMYNVGVIKLQFSFFMLWKMYDINFEVFNCKIASGNAKNCITIGYGMGGSGESKEYYLNYKKGVSAIVCKDNKNVQGLCLEGVHTCDGDAGGPLICDGLIYGLSSAVEGPVCSEATKNFYVPLAPSISFLRLHTPCTMFENSSKATIEYNKFLILFSSLILKLFNI